MNSAHLHLLLNHVPLIGILIGMLVCVSGFIFKDYSIKRIALAIFIFSALSALPAYLTGEGAEEAIEHLPGVEKTLIEKHEEGALTFIWLIGAMGVAALVGLQNLPTAGV